jgi:hypothetical protein
VKSLNKACESIIHKFNKNPKSLFKVICFYNSENTLVILTHAHDSYFIDYNISFTFILRLDKLKSTHIAILLSFNLEYLSKTSLSKLTYDIVKLTRIHSLNLGVLSKRLLKLFVSWQLLHQVGLSVTLRIIHGNENINNIGCVFINLFFSKVK